MRSLLLTLILAPGIALAQDTPDAGAPTAQAGVMEAAAWLRRGEAADKAGLPYAALLARLEAARVHPATAAGVFDDVLDTADDVAEERLAGSVLSSALGIPADEEIKARMALLAARHQFDKGSWGAVLGLLTMVPDDSSVDLEADILKGITLAQQGRYTDAMVPMLTSMERAKQADWAPHKVATLALNNARVFYAAGDQAQAMAYYDLVPRADAWWPEAHFERAWAHFQVQDMPGTLGILHTHTSPFFDDRYQPEAELLRAQALFLMCKFPETTRAIDRFQGKYAPVLDQLNQVTSTLTPETAWTDLLAARAGQPTKAPATLLGTFDGDARVDEALAAFDQAATELAAIRGASFEGADTLAERLEARRDARIRAEGQRVIDRLTEARADLDDMLQGIELTRVDLLTFEADLYNRAAATGQTLEVDGADDKRRRLRRKGKHVWPFEGEYWADELGWYRVDARPDCPEGMQRGG